MIRAFRFFLLSALIAGGVAFAQNPAKPIIEKMLSTMDRIQTLSARIKRLERVNGVMEEGELKFKVMYQPTFKAYVYNMKPEVGAEVLFVKGWNNDNAYVHPNKFPWVNVSLDPEGSTMCGTQHHSLFSIGSEYFKKIIRYYLTKYENEFDEHVFYQGTQKWYNKTCHVIKLVYNDYHTVNYTVKANESLFDIDRKLFVPAAKILELNPSITGYQNVKAGQVIKIPNVYGKETVLLVDSETYLPVVQIIYDDKGMFEKYEYFDVKINPRFTTAEFTTDYPDYGF